MCRLDQRDIAELQHRLEIANGDGFDFQPVFFSVFSQAYLSQPLVAKQEILNRYFRKG